MQNVPLKVSIVGCGQIADAHLQEIKFLKSAEVVAVCDTQPDLAHQAALRFGVPREFHEFGEMLAAVRPDVVHITTPPHSHAALACQAIEAGCHVYVEKPFTATVNQCDEILDAAERCDRLVCVGHDQLFDPVWLRCRAMLSHEQLGQITHVESLQGYDLSGPFGRLFALDPSHWVHSLPGGLFQNVVSHALYRITDTLPGALSPVHAHWFSNQPSGGFPSEMRAMLSNGKASAFLGFFSSVHPLPRITRIYGTRKSIEVDFDAQTIRAFASQRLPGALGKIDLPWNATRQASSALFRNLWRFVKADLHYFGGMRRLFDAFYKAISEKRPSPIAAGEIRRVTVLMDEVFSACRESKFSTIAQRPASQDANARIRLVAEDKHA